MKQISLLNQPLLAAGIAAAMLLAAFPVLSADSDRNAPTQSAAGVTYMSGGVGEESMERLKSLAGDFNLKLVFALKSGDYLSDVRVAIQDAGGRTILDTTAKGPWLLARLPPGSYRIVATLATGKPQAQQIVIGAERLATLDFRWISE
jgi:hypothetical protein